MLEIKNVQAPAIATFNKSCKEYNIKEKVHGDCRALLFY